MRIGINTLFLIPGEVGGSEIYLIHTLLALVNSRNSPEIVLFTNLENDQFFRQIFQHVPHVSFHPLFFRAQNRPHRIFQEQSHLPVAVYRSRATLLWSPGYTAPLFCPVPQVVSILDMQYKSHPEDMTFSARVITDILVRLAAKKCHRILTLSEFSKREILRHTSALPEQTHVTLLAAEPKFIPAQPASVTRPAIARLLPFDEPYLLCVANTYPHKNVASLVQAFGNMQHLIPHHLVLVGKPRRGEPEVSKVLDRLINPKRVHRLQNIPLSDLIALYQCSDLFVFPSLYEGFGLPVLEAMMAETLVVAARKGSVPEVGGDAAEYFTPGIKGDMERQILKTLCLPKEARQNRIQYARKHARTFTWERTARETLSHFRLIGTPLSKSRAHFQ